MPARYELNQLVRENNYYQEKTFTYEYVNGNIKFKHEYAYTTGNLPATPIKTIEYHYEDSTWGDVLTKITVKHKGTVLRLTKLNITQRTRFSPRPYFVLIKCFYIKQALIIFCQKLL